MTVSLVTAANLAIAGFTDLDVKYRLGAPAKDFFLPVDEVVGKVIDDLEDHGMVPLNLDSTKIGEHYFFSYSEEDAILVAAAVNQVFITSDAPPPFDAIYQFMGKEEGFVSVIPREKFERRAPEIAKERSARAESLSRNNAGYAMPSFDRDDLSPSGQ